MKLKVSRSRLKAQLCSDPIVRHSLTLDYAALIMHARRCTLSNEDKPSIYALFLS